MIVMSMMIQMRLFMIDILLNTDTVALSAFLDIFFVALFPFVALFRTCDSSILCSSNILL